MLVGAEGDDRNLVQNNLLHDQAVEVGIVIAFVPYIPIAYRELVEHPFVHLHPCAASVRHGIEIRELHRGVSAVVLLLDRQDAADRVLRLVLPQELYLPVCRRSRPALLNTLADATLHQHVAVRIDRSERTELHEDDVFLLVHDIGLQYRRLLESPAAAHDFFIQ